MNSATSRLWMREWHIPRVLLAVVIQCFSEVMAVLLQCNIPSLDQGMAYTQISAGNAHTVLLRSDGSAVAIGDNGHGQCNIPALDENTVYTQVSAGILHTVLLRSDGSAVATGNNRMDQCNIQPLDEGMQYTQVSAGGSHTVLLRSDGSAVAIGRDSERQCRIPPLDEGMAYTQASAGTLHTVLLQSDGCAVAFGDDGDGECSIQHRPLGDGEVYYQISAGHSYTVLLQSDGRPFADGKNDHGQCHIPWPKSGMYRDNFTYGTDLALQLEFVDEDDAVKLICSTLAGEERLHLTAQGVDSAWETHKRIARELSVNLPNLQLVLPDGQLLANVCRANAGASVAEVAQSTKHQRLT